MQESVLGKAQPADRAAPVVVHGAESGPCPTKLSQSLNEASNRPSPPQGLDVVLELVGQTLHQSVACDLAPEPEDGFTLDDGVNFKGVTGNTHGHKGPELHPLISFGPDSGFEGMVVGGLDWPRGGLNVCPRRAHTSGQRSGMTGFDEHRGRKTPDAWKAEGGPSNTGVGGRGEVERG